MTTIRISAAGSCAPTLALGRRGENLATEIRFDFSSWLEEFGEGRVELYARRCGDENAYPVYVTVEGQEAVWALTATDTHTVGYGTAEFVWVAGETVVKSVVYGTIVEPDIGQPTDTPPEPYESWLDTLTELAADTEAAAQRAETAEEAAEAAQAGAEAAQAATEEALGPVREDVESLKNVTAYTTDSVMDETIPFGIWDSGSGGGISASQAGETVTLNGTSTAASSQGHTKILITDHVELWNGNTPSTAYVYPIRTIAGRKYRLTADIVSGTRTAGSVGLGIIRLYYAFSGAGSDYVNIGMSSTHGELEFTSAGETMQIRLLVARETAVTDLVVRVALRDVTVDSVQSELTFDAAPTESSTNLVKSGGIYTAIQTVSEALATLDGKALQYARQTTSSDDINDMWDNGIYVARTVSTVPANSPTVNKFVMIVAGNISSSNQLKAQIIIGLSGYLFTRTKDGSTVSGWNTLPLSDVWTDKIDAVSDAVYYLTKNELPVDSLLVKGNYNTHGVIISGNGVSTYPMYDLKKGTKITLNLPDDIFYTVWEGNSRTSTKRTHQTVDDESFTTTKRYLGFIFYKRVEGEDPHNTTVDEIKGRVSVSFDFESGGIDVSDFVPEMPETVGQANVLRRAAQVVEIPFTTAAVLPYFSNHDLAEDTDTAGIPYSSVRPEALFVPNCVSFHAFMTASLNPNSYLYKKKLAIPNYSGRTYYGSVCSSFVAWCYGIDDVVPTTISFDTYPGFEALPAAQQDVQSLKLGDMLNKSGSHIVIVTGIYRNKYGNICYVEVSEETSVKNVWKARSILRSASYVKSSYLNSGFKIFRYSEIDDVTYEPSPWVHLDVTETAEPVYNTLLYPRRGDKANWPAGSDVEIDIIGEHSYTSYEYTELDTSVTETGTVSGTVITLPNCPVGRYKLRLTDGNNTSGYVYFDVIETAGTTFEVLTVRKVDVTWQTSLGTPASISFCCSVEGQSDYLATHAFHILTDEEIAAGHAVVDAPPANATIAANDIWLMKVMYKTEFGLYSGQQTAVQVTTLGTVTETAYVESDCIVDVT